MKRLILSWMLLLLGVPAATEPSPPPRPSVSTGAEANRPPSYWGAIPAADDSNVARFAQRSKPAWEVALDVPYRIVVVPVYFFLQGVKGTVIFFDEHAGVRRFLKQISKPRIGPFQARFSLSAGGLQGTGLGVSATAGGELHKLKIGGKYTTAGNAKATLGGTFTPSEGNRLEFGLGYRLRPNARFFGIGPGSKEEDESFYRQEVGWGGVSYQKEWGAGFASELGLLISGVGAYDPRGQDDPPLSERFSQSLPYGFSSRTDGTSYSFGLGHETTTETGRPERGGLRRARATYFQDNRDQNENYWTYRFELQQFLPLWFTSRALALRGLISWIDAKEEDNIPFQRLMTNDEPDLVRGFRDFRYYDEGITAFSAEYRWPVWADGTVGGAGVDAYLFTDIGQVFGQFGEISGDSMRKSLGGGFRWIAREGFAGRLEISRSAEEWVFRLRGDQIFQYAKSGLYHGRNPIPPR